MTDAPKPYSLRDLPTPAKLVITCYLLGVGLGYFSALVQLHLQHSAREGEALPKLKDVVEIFAGWREATDDVTVETILAILRDNAAAARRALAEAVTGLDPRRRCGCRDAMRFGIITDRSSIPPAAKARLEPIAGRYF